MSNSVRGTRTPPKIKRPEPAPVTQSPVIAVFEVSPERDSGAFWAAHPDTPVLEEAANGECTVTFLWRDDPEHPATEVLLFVNRVTDERDLYSSLMRRVPGTDIWHLSYRMQDDWRASYCFVVREPGGSWPWTEGDQLSIRRALDQGVEDSRNPKTCLNRAGTRLSVVELPAAPPQPWLVRREGLAARGVVTEHAGPGGRRVWLYQPPCAEEAPTRSLPIVVLLDGEVWTSTQDIATTVDNLLSDGLIRPCLVVMPETGGRDRRWAELDADGDGARWIAHALLPWARNELRDVLHDRSAAGEGLEEHCGPVIIAGQSLGAYTALRCALEYPHLVDGVLSQSASLWQRRVDLRALEASASEPGPRPRFYLEVGTQEWVLREPNTAFADRLMKAGAEVQLVEYNGGHDYACWRGGIADGLRVLLSPDHLPNTLGCNHPSRSHGLAVTDGIDDEGAA